MQKSKEQIKSCKPDDPVPTYAPLLNNDIKYLLKCWDEKHGTELKKIEDLLGYFSGRFKLYWGGLNNSLKFGCHINSNQTLRSGINVAIKGFDYATKANIPTLPPIDKGSFVSEFCDVFFPVNQNKLKIEFYVKSQNVILHTKNKYLQYMIN